MPQAEGGFANSADFIDTVLAVAAQGRITHESALLLIFVLRRAGKKRIRMVEAYAPRSVSTPMPARKPTRGGSSMCRGGTLKELCPRVACTR
jgi:hypothetical protein